LIPRHAFSIDGEREDDCDEDMLMVDDQDIPESEDVTFIRERLIKLAIADAEPVANIFGNQITWVQQVSSPSNIAQLHSTDSAMAEAEPLGFFGAQGQSYQQTSLPESILSKKPLFSERMSQMKKGCSRTLLDRVEVSRSSNIFTQTTPAAVTSSATNGSVNIFGNSSSPTQVEHKSDSYNGQPAGSSPYHFAATNLSSGINPNGMEQSTTAPSLFSGVATHDTPGKVGQLSQDISQPSSQIPTCGVSSSQSLSATSDIFIPLTTPNTPASDMTAEPLLYESPVKVSSSQNTAVPLMQPDSVSNGVFQTESNGAGCESSEVPSKKPHSQSNCSPPVESSDTDGLSSKMTPLQPSTSAEDPFPSSSTINGGMASIPPVMARKRTPTKRRGGCEAACRKLFLNHFFLKHLQYPSMKEIRALESKYNKKQQRELSKRPVPRPKKRKAEEAFGKESGYNGAIEPVKRVRTENTVSPPPPTTTSTQTANPVADTANSTGAQSQQTNPPAPRTTKRKADKDLAEESGAVGTAKKARKDDVVASPVSSRTRSKMSKLVADNAYSTGITSEPLSCHLTTGLSNSATPATNNSESLPSIYLNTPLLPPQNLAPNTLTSNPAPIPISDDNEDYAQYSEAEASRSGEDTEDDLSEAFSSEGEEGDDDLERNNAEAQRGETTRIEEQPEQPASWLLQVTLTIIRYLRQMYRRARNRR
jgi:hypothetical protein